MRPSTVGAGCKPGGNMIHSRYLNSPLDKDKRKEILDRLEKQIDDSGIVFQAIAFCGMSGALIAPALAQRLNCGLILVRKEKEPRHTYLKVEGYTKGSRYIIIDDQIATGNTIKYILETIHQDDNFQEMNAQAVFLYNNELEGGRVSAYVGGAVWKLVQRIRLFCVTGEVLCEED